MRRGLPLLQCETQLDLAELLFESISLVTAAPAARVTLNTTVLMGNQLPFTSINYGTCTLPEGRMFTKAILETSLKGLGKFGRTAIFPCQIFQYAKDINGKLGTPNYDLYQLALKSTARRLYPNYANQDWFTDINAIKTDRDFRKKVLSELSDSDYQKLIDRIEADPALGERLGLIVVDE